MVGLWSQYSCAGHDAHCTTFIVFQQQQVSFRSVEKAVPSTARASNDRSRSRSIAGYYCALGQKNPYICPTSSAESALKPYKPTPPGRSSPLPPSVSPQHCPCRQAQTHDDNASVDLANSARRFMPISQAHIPACSVRIVNMQDSNGHHHRYRPSTRRAHHQEGGTEQTKQRG